MMDTRTVRADVGNKNSISATEAIEKERQRKFLIQVQKSRILAAAQILHSTKTQATLNGSTINTSSPKPISQETTGTKLKYFLYITLSINFFKMPVKVNSNKNLLY